MKSLFLRIFLSFWIAQALFLVLAILVTIVFRPRNSTWEALRTTVLNDAVSTYEETGNEGLRNYLENLDHTQHVRAYLFDEKGNELSNRPAPDWAMRVASGGPRVPHDGFLFPAPPVQRDSRASSDGKHRYTVVLGLPPGPRVFIGPRGVPFTGLIIGVVTSGLVCYLLAWFLTKPIVRLRTAARQLAAGDLTARTGAPASMRRDEVAGLMRDFDAMAERIETLLKAQSRLLNDISHELRSPLARLEDGEQIVPQTPVALDEIITSVTEDAEFEAQARRCHVRVSIPEGEWKVRGNASLLHSAVENVVRNAIRYTQEGTSVGVELTSEAKAGAQVAVLRVSDSGPGVPAAALGKLFEPFYRLDDARGRQTGGVGLGLAITERAVRFHGGKVAASNRAGGGLVVEIRLPMISGGEPMQEVESLESVVKA